MSESASPDRVSATGRIAAPAHQVWLIVSDPNISDQLRAKFSWPVVPADRLQKSVANLKRITSPEDRDA